ncbi:MAG TPA: hypothetical protein VFV34_06545 [Blastocatellia bacterium]|nr:hypothetical protein [Blastocatellia bacterium]
MTRVSLLATLFIVATASQTFAQVKVEPGNLKETRRTDGFFNQLEVELKIAGTGLKDAKALRVVVDKAIDDTGKSLVTEKTAGASFKEVDSTETETKLDVELANTERRASALKEISGSIEIFVPARDPQSTASIAALQKQIGKQISSPVLKSAGVEVTIWNKEMFDARKKAEEERVKTELEQKTRKAEQSGDLKDAAEVLAQSLISIFGGMFSSFGDMEPNDLAFNVKDPKSKLVAIEVEDEKGKKIENHGRMTMGSDPRTIIVHFEEKLPPAARVRFYVLTPRSLVRTPFKLNTIPLP